MIQYFPSPQFNRVRSPFNLPVSESITAKRALPALGNLVDKTLSNHCSAFGPATSKREKPVISSNPTPSRITLHSLATIS